jgi:aspartate/glutamate racemase
VVIHERIRKEEVEEIQPIIHREHEQLEVHQILQPMVEQIVQPTVIQERLLAAETRPLVHRGGYMGSVAPVATSDVQSFRKVVEKPAISVDVERRKVLEEIQPVVYKEILQPTIIRETKDIYEKIIEAPTIICSTLPQQFVGKAQPQFEPTLRSSSLQGQNLQGQTFQ